MTRSALFWVLLVALTVWRSLGLFASAGLAFDDQPLMNTDYPLHAYHAELGEHFRYTRGTRWGYDPNFMAGYVKSAHFDASVVVFEWARAPLGGLFRGQKRLVLATPLLVLGLMVVALWGFGLPPAAVRIGALLTVLEFWLSLPVVFLLLAMVGNLVGIGLALAALGLLHRALAGSGEGAERTRTDRRAAFAFFPVVALAIRIHPHALLIATIGVAVSCALARGRVLLRLLALAWVGAVCLTYVVPYLAFRSRVDTGMRAIYWALARPFEPLHYFFSLDEGARQAGAFELVLLAIAAWGVVRGWRAGRRLAAGAIAATYGALFVITFYGSLTGIGASLQPLRLAIALAHLSIVPAAAAIHAASGNDPRAARLGLASGVVLLVLLVAGQRGFAGTMRVGLSEDDRKVLAWVARIQPDARVLIEDGAVGGPLGGDEDSGGGLLPLVPHLALREVIGGPVAWVHLKTRYAGAGDAMLFGRPAAELEDAAALLARYNVGGALVWSKDAYLALSRVPGMARVTSIGRLVLLVRNASGAVIEGSGRVFARPDRLEVSDAKPQNGRIVLSYHWDPVLAVDPPAKLVPVILGEDPVPFVGVENPPANFVVKVPAGLSAWELLRRELGR